MATPKLFSLSVLAASALAISTPAMAEAQSVNWKAKEVQHEDLDLSTAKGQERLKTRVRQAVKQVCASPRAITLRERVDQDSCEKNSMARAIPKAEQQIAAYLESRRLASRTNEAIVGN